MLSVVKIPDFMVCTNEVSNATCQVPVTVPAISGVTRVQIITAFGVGSAYATPW